MRPTATIKIQDGSKIVVPDDISVLTTFVLREQEDCFEDEIHFARRMVFPGMKSIDIGASYGLYTMALAKGSGEEGRVISFEPTPETADCLTETLCLNGIGNVELKRMAVSETSGKRNLYFSPSTESNHLGTDAVPDSETQYIEVYATSIDEIRSTLPAGIDFMKIDAEGEEESILRGARSFLQKESPLVMFELNGEKRCDSSFFALLRDWKYPAYRLLPGLNVLVPLPLDGQLPHYLLNVFCCKDDRASRLQDRGLLLMDDEDSSSIDVEDGAWAQKCRSVAATRPYVDRWIQATSKPTARMKRYLNALDLVVMAEDDKYSSAVRVSALKKAAMLLSMLCDVEATVPRLSSLARVLAALGEKTLACEAIQKALNLCPDLEFELGDEPFLLPAPRVEWRESTAEPGRFLVLALFEQLQRLYCFSTIICPQFYLEIIDDFTSKYILTPELERRRQLALMFLQLQKAPLSSELLERLTPDNMNPGYWNCGS
ncbi:MAG: FkbM family methyltransferase [Desulfuromonadales bacterium]|nr:FkbM family methyltransferase [Desulfuromonadales bacterium]